MKTTVVAVVGCGRIANNAHFPALTKLENVRIKYACDLILEKAVAAKEKFPKIEEVITDYKVALADPEVEAVFVLTPNFAHYTVTMDALRAGKHVMCEKPVTVSYELSCEMAAEADKQGKILNIGVCNRYHKSVELLEELNRQGVEQTVTPLRLPLLHAANAITATHTKNIFFIIILFFLFNTELTLRFWFYCLNNKSQKIT